MVEDEGHVVATAPLTICLDAMYRKQPFGVLENVVVNAETRSKGIGQFLLSAIDHIAVTKDCSKVMLLSSSDRGYAYAFFEATGYDGDAKRGFVKYRAALEASFRTVAAFGGGTL